MFYFLQHLKNAQIAKQSYFCKQLLKSPILTDLAFFKDQMAALIHTHTRKHTTPSVQTNRCFLCLWCLCWTLSLFCDFLSTLFFFFYLFFFNKQALHSCFEFQYIFDCHFLFSERKRYLKKQTNKQATTSCVLSLRY